MDGELTPERYVSIKNIFDQIKKHTNTGLEYWSARELQGALGYVKWDNFEGLIEKAQQACAGVGTDPRYHFLESRKVSTTGPDSRDVLLTRAACYLIAMNGEPSKPEIAAAQVYFAVQTRLQEIADAQQEADEIGERIELRDRLKQHNKELSGAARQAGVQKYGLFNHAGYFALYGGHGLPEIRQLKGLRPNEDILDRASSEELGANDFRITQTAAKLQREKITGEDKAIRTHADVGKQVRKAIKEMNGTMPEALPPEESIEKLAKVRKRRELPPA